MWAQVTGMKLPPHVCAACGNNGEMTEDGPQPAYFAEAVDINWGDSLYLCSSCVGILADLAGRVSSDEHEKLRRDHEELQGRFEELSHTHTTLESRVKRMIDGSRAKKEVVGKTKNAA